MMKQIFSILLSFIFLASHMYLTMGTHFCGGEAIETRIVLGEAHLGCGIMDMEESCNDSNDSNNNETSFDNPLCCQNEYQTIQSSNEFLKGAAQISFSVEFAVAFIHTTLSLNEFSNSTHRYYTEYISPPLEKDIQLFFQTFLI